MGKNESLLLQRGERRGSGSNDDEGGGEVVSVQVQRIMPRDHYYKGKDYFPATSGKRRYTLQCSCS